MIMTHDYFKQGPSLPVIIHWFSSVWAPQITHDEASSFYSWEASKSTWMIKWVLVKPQPLGFTG